MKPAVQTVSPRRVAEALGVSESSVKRWSDQGLMETLKTAGGHRKLAVADVLRFVRAQGYRVVRPDLLGLLGVQPKRDDSLLEALVAGDGKAIRRIVIGRFVGGEPLTEIFDDVLAPALREIGAGWEHGRVRVFEEHRAVGLVQQTLHELRDLLPRTSRRGPTAIVAGASGDPYTVAITMSELAIASLGWTVQNLGPDTPAHTLCEALVEIGPRLLALGVNYITDQPAFVAQFAKVSELARAKRIPIAIGGAAATRALRDQLQYAAHCESMRELTSFCESLK